MMMMMMDRRLDLGGVLSTTPNKIDQNTRGKVTIEIGDKVVMVVMVIVGMVVARLTPPVAAPRWSTSESNTTHGERTRSSLA